MIKTAMFLALVLTVIAGFAACGILTGAFVADGSELRAEAESLCQQVVGAYENIESSVVAEYERIESAFVKAYLE